jgi:hypothetical protein
LLTEQIEEVAAGITDKPTVGIRDDAFEPPGRDLRRVGVKVSPMTTTTQPNRDRAPYRQLIKWRDL